MHHEIQVVQPNLAGFNSQERSWHDQNTLPQLQRQEGGLLIRA